MSKQKLVIATAVVVLLTGAGFYYFRVGAVPHKDTTATSPGQLAGALVFTSPPRETPEEGERSYKPLVEYLSKAIGKPVVYKHPGTWGVYRTEMLAGKYDIVFDGPHFVDYRIQKLGHSAVAKLEEVH